MTFPTRVLGGVDGLAVPFVLNAAVATRPDILIRDFVDMRGGDMDATMCKGGRAFFGPQFKFFSVWVIFDITDHEIQEMTVLVGNDVDEAI